MNGVAVAYSVALVALGALGLLVWRHRSYFSEVRALIRSRTFELAEHSSAQSPEDLGLYYMFDRRETQPHVTQAEADFLREDWTPPEAYGVRDHPVAIAQDGLVSLNRFKSTGVVRFAERAALAADELLRLQDDDGAWRYSFDFIDLPAGWSSAMAQGQGASLLARVHQVAGGDVYVEAARRALDYAMEPIASGGTMGAYSDGTPFLEEYPGSEVSPNTLNGSIFALWGLRDFALLVGDASTAQVFRDLSEGIAAHLSDYDTGDWTLYSLRRDGSHLADDRYHRVHIVQARVMADITRDSRWGAAAERWERYYYDRIGRNGYVVWQRDLIGRIGVLGSLWGARK